MMLQDGRVAVRVHEGSSHTFAYQSCVVVGSDQNVAYEHLASHLVAKAREGYV